MSTIPSPTFTLDVAWPIDLDVDEEAFGLEASEVGGQSDSSGMGFGMRDIQFTFDSETNAKAAAVKVCEILQSAGCEVNTETDKGAEAYAIVFQNELDDEEVGINA